MRSKNAPVVPEFPAEVVRIRFIVREAPWEAWEIAALPAGEAEKFLRRGVAEPAPEVADGGRG